MRVRFEITDIICAKEDCALNKSRGIEECGFTNIWSWLAGAGKVSIRGVSK
jgi:hypothetical protein